MRKAYILKRLTKQVKRFAALMLIVLMAVGNVFADEVTFVFSDQGYANAQVITVVTSTVSSALPAPKTRQVLLPPSTPPPSRLRRVSTATNRMAMAIP